jgi:hypothetical protein
MADRKKTTKAPVRAAAPTRSSRGKWREGAFFLVSPPRAGLPPDYAETLSEIKKRIQAERLRVREDSLPYGAVHDGHWDSRQRETARRPREGRRRSDAGVQALDGRAA